MRQQAFAGKKMTTVRQAPIFRKPPINFLLPYFFTTVFSASFPENRISITTQGLAILDGVLKICRPSIWQLSRRGHCVCVCAGNVYDGFVPVSRWPFLWSPRSHLKNPHPNNFHSCRARAVRPHAGHKPGYDVAQKVSCPQNSLSPLRHCYHLIDVNILATKAHKSTRTVFPKSFYRV